MKSAAASRANGGRITHQSLERGLRLLELIAGNGGPTSLAETTRRTGLHRSTAHHLLQTLVGLGYLRQDQGTRAYELSAKLFQLTGQSWTAEQLGVIGEPILAELARRSEEASSFAAYRNGVVRIVAKRDPDGPVRVVQNLGSDRPVHATAVGKAILAWLPTPELAAILGHVRLDRFTPKTLTDPRALQAHLRRVRQAGYAIDDEEHIPGIRCIAAPVFGYGGTVLASLCAVGPKNRLTHQKLRALRTPLLALASQLSQRLGWEPEEGGREGPGAG